MAIQSTGYTIGWAQTKADGTVSLTTSFWEAGAREVVATVADREGYFGYPAAFSARANVDVVPVSPSPPSTGPFTVTVQAIVPLGVMSGPEAKGVKPGG